MVSGPISDMFCCTLTSDSMFEHECVYCHTNLLHILLHNSHQSYLWFSSFPPAWEHNLYHFIQLTLQFLSLFHIHPNFGPKHFCGKLEIVNRLHFLSIKMKTKQLRSAANSFFALPCMQTMETERAEIALGAH